MKIKKLLSLSLLVLTTIAVSSCGGKKNTTPPEPPKPDLTYELTLEPNKEFLSSQKRKIAKVNGEVKEVVDYNFNVPENLITVENYNDLLIGANPLLLTPIAVEYRNGIEARTLSESETLTMFNPITEFSQSGYGNADIDESLYNTAQLRTCYTISQSSSGTLQSKYYNVSIIIEDTEAPVFSQNYTALIPFTLNKDAIISSIKESIRMFVFDNNSATELTITLKDDSVLTGLSQLNKEQSMHFDVSDSDGNELLNQEFKYKLVDNLNYFETIDQETVNTVSYKNAQADYIAQNYELYKGIYSYKILNEDELVFSNANADNIEEIKAVINKEQTIKYGIYEDNQLIGEFNYKFKMIDDVAPYMVWADDGSVITDDYLSDLTAEHDNDLNRRYGELGEFLDPMSLYNELLKYVVPKDDINDNCKVILTIDSSNKRYILARFYATENSNKSFAIQFGAAINNNKSNFETYLTNYITGEYDENGLIK